METNNRTNKRELSAIDLLYYIIKEWRKLLVAMFVGAIVFVVILIAITFFSENKTASGEIDYELSVKAYEDIIDKNQQLMKTYQEYLDKSIRMRIDPYHKPNLISKYYIKLDPKVYDLYKNPIAFDPANRILDLYVAKLNSKIDWNKVMEITNMELPYAKETISIWRDNSGFINTQITFDDENVAMKLRDLIDKEITGLHNEVQNDTYEHEFISVKQPIIYSLDTDLADDQKSYKNRIEDCMDIIQNADVKIKKLKKLEKSQINSFSSISIATYLKYIIIGAFVGCFLVVIIYMLIYIFGGQIHTDDEIKLMFGFELLSVIRSEKKNKKIFSCIDDFIYQTLKKTLYNDTACDAVKRVLLYIDSMKQEDALIDNIKIGIISSCMEEQIRTFIDAIPTEYHKNMIYVGNPKNSAEDSVLTASMDKIILIETLDVTKLIDVTMNVDITNLLKKEIIGYVLYA